MHTNKNPIIIYNVKKWYKIMKKKSGFSGIGFILATAGGSVGLGNLWSFPYKTSQNGGAAFVIVYVISVIVLGLALAIGEVFIGRRSQANNVTAYKRVHKNLGWIGLIAIVSSLLIGFYYIVIGGFTVKYSLNSFADTATNLKSFAGNIPEVILFSGIFLLLAIVIISAGVKQGIEKASKILMPTLIVILVGIVIYCLCLGNGVLDGLNYYLNPDFKALGARGILSAMSQAFFSISIGVGALLAYGSYTDKDVNIGKSVIWIVFFDTLVALLAGLAIFPAIYHYQAETGQVLKISGIGLLFESMPLIFNTLGMGGKIISFLFFGMIAIAAITSLISLIEVPAQYLIQRFKMKRKKACLIFAVFSFIVSIPIGISLGFSLNGSSMMVIGNRSLLEILDQIVTSVFIPVAAFFITLSIGWFMYKPSNKNELFSFKFLSHKLQEEGLNLGKFNYFFAFMIKYIAPLLILGVDIVGLIDNVFPGWKFDLSGLIVELIGIAFVGILIAIYFLVVAKKDTGDNSFEVVEQMEAQN